MGASLTMQCSSRPFELTSARATAWKTIARFSGSRQKGAALGRSSEFVEMEGSLLNGSPLPSL